MRSEPAGEQSSKIREATATKQQTRFPICASKASKCWADEVASKKGTLKWNYGEDKAKCVFPLKESTADLAIAVGRSSVSE